MTAIATVAARSRRKFPLSVAWLMIAARPVVEMVWPRKWKYSATMLAFNAPTEAVTKPEIKKRNIEGRNSLRKRWVVHSLYVLQTSFKSAGIAVAPAITLNNMYHCVPRSSKTIEPIPRPPPARISTRRIIGNSAVAGTDAAICAIGCAMADSLGRNPIATPVGTVHRAASSRTASTRKNVAPAPQRIWRNSADDIVAMIENTFATAYAIAVSATTATARRAQCGTRFLPLVSDRVSCSLAKCKSNLSRRGKTRERVTNGRSFELRNIVKIGDRGISAEPTCSTLNFSAHAITGRQTS